MAVPVPTAQPEVPPAAWGGRSSRRLTTRRRRRRQAALGLHPLCSFLQFRSEVADVRAAGRHGIVVAARSALDHPGGDRRHDEAHHDHSAGHQEDRSHPSGRRDRHVIAVADGRHRAERPPDGRPERGDGRAGCGPLELQDDDFRWITDELMRIADASCKGRVVSVLEGGYSMEGLANGTAAHVRRLMAAA